MLRIELSLERIHVHALEEIRRLHYSQPLKWIDRIWPGHHSLWFGAVIAFRLQQRHCPAMVVIANPPDEHDDDQRDYGRISPWKLLSLRSHFSADQSEEPWCDQRQQQWNRDHRLEDGDNVPSIPV